MPASAARPPLGSGGISVGVHTEPGSAGAILDHLVEQAHFADAAGYDGVSVSEHHGGFEGYVPSPLQVAGWLLSAMERGWAATGPLLLSLRNPTLVIEETAWLAARFPGRVGLCVGPGFAPRDFEVAGVPLEERLSRYRAALESVALGLSGRGPEGLAGDPAVAALSPGEVPLVATLGGPVGAVHAGRTGTGAMVDSFASVDKASSLFERYRAAGGRGPRVLCRRVWFGPPDPERMEVLARNYRSIGSGSAIGASQTDFISTDDADEMAERLAGEVRAAGADALLLRFNFPGLAHSALLDQLQQTGSRVLPALRERLGWQQEVRA
jgi:alkanesulfonate monooxygenase SsuD/methylene tetrahydromethanopterin reductase-like flavin-dependent oxidoreductase (luciferase family)